MRDYKNKCLRTKPAEDHTLSSRLTCSTTSTVATLQSHREVHRTAQCLGWSKFLYKMRFPACRRHPESGGEAPAAGGLAQALSRQKSQLDFAGSLNLAYLRVSVTFVAVSLMFGLLTSHEFSQVGRQHCVPSPPPGGPVAPQGFGVAPMALLPPLAQALGAPSLGAQHRPPLPTPACPSHLPPAAQRRPVGLPSAPGAAPEAARRPTERVVASKGTGIAQHGLKAGAWRIYQGLRAAFTSSSSITQHTSLERAEKSPKGP